MIESSFHKLKKLGPHYLEGVTTYWDMIIFATLTFVFMIIPVNLSLPHDSSLLETWFDVLVTPVFAWDFIRSWRAKSPELKGTRNIWFQSLSIIPFQSLAQASGISFIGLPLLLAFRLFRAPLVYSRLKERSKDQLVTRWLKIWLILFMGMIVSHFFACAWIVISGVHAETNVTTYIKAIYFVITTLSTVGYGDITPNTDLGRIFTMSTMVVGVGCYGILIGQVSTMMLESDKRTEATREKLQALTSLLKYYDIPPELQDQAFKIYKHMLSRQVSEDEQKVMQELPKGLQSELQIYMNMKPLANVSLFNGVSSESLKDIAKNMEQVFLSPNEAIIRTGEIGHEMFVIGHGSVDVHVGTMHIATLNDGHCFGEMALISDEERKADVTATSYCDLFKLTKENFVQLLARHTDLREQVNRTAEARRQQNELRASQGPVRIKAG
jgi:voltage-gated potassium channel